MIQIVIIFSYMLITAIVPLLFRKRAQEDTKAFYTASGSLTTIVVGALLFSEIVAGSGTIGNAANAFTGGLSNAIWANWGMAIGCALVVLTVSKFYRTMSVKFGAMTIPEAYAVMFGPRVRTLMMFIVALVYVILFSSQSYAAATILSPLMNIDQQTMTWIITALFIGIAIFGGMVGVSWISVVHSGVMLLGLMFVALAAVKSVGGISQLRQSIPVDNFSIIGNKPMNTLASALGTAVSFIASSNVSTALFGAKSKKAGNGGLLIAGFTVMLFALMPATIGLCARVVLPDIIPNTALFQMSNVLGPIYSGVLSMAIIAAIWSTGPTLLLVVSATMTKDFYVSSINPKASEKQQLRFSFFVILIAGVLGTWFGMNARSILDNMLGAFQIRSIVGIVLLMALAWPRVSERAAFWSMLGGGVAASIWFFTGNPFGVAALWPGAAVCLIILIPMTLMSKNRISEGYQKYHCAKIEMDNSRHQDP